MHTMEMKARHFDFLCNALLDKQFQENLAEFLLSRYVTTECEEDRVFSKQLILLGMGSMIAHLQKLKDMTDEVANAETDNTTGTHARENPATAKAEGNI